MQRHSQGLSRPRLQDILSTSLKCIPNVVVLIDAFDECQFRADNLAVLRSLATCGASILITSRKIPDIESLFSRDQQLEIRPDDSDIADMIDSKLSEIEEDLEFDQAFKKDVIDNIITRCHGIFLLAKLIVDDLLMTSSRKQLRKALTGLPKTLPEMYQKTMDQIKCSRHADLATRVIRWVIYAARPLRIQELRHGLAVEAGTSGLDEDNLTSKKTIVSACLGLLALDTDEFLRPIHASAFEFLTKHDFEFTNAIHMDFTEVCLIYLSYTVFGDPCQNTQDLEDRVATYHFACYASQNLGFHCRRVEAQFKKPLLELLNDEGLRNSSTQLYFHRVLEDEALRQQAFAMLPRGQTALQVACRLGLVRTSEHMIQSGCGVSVSDARGWTPLSTAASYGHIDIIRLLIKAGADVNGQDIHKWSPLIWSVLKNRVNVAQELLSAGASIKASDGNGWTAMHWAASIGEPNMIAVLSPEWDRLFEARHHRMVQGKAKSKEPDQRLDPLLLAIDFQNTAALEKMIDVHSESFRAVEATGPLDTGGLFRFLTKQEKMIDHYDYASPDSPSMVFPESFLVKLFDSAIRSEHLNMVKFLIEQGVKDESYREINGRTPLHTAVFCRTPDIAQFLIEHGFDLGARDAKGVSALDVAVRNGTVEVIDYLLGLPDAKSLVYGTGVSPLHLVWHNQRLLLNQSGESHKGLSKQQLASQIIDSSLQELDRAMETQIAVAKLLLGLGADVNKLEASQGQSPIFYALESGLEAVQMVLAHHARTDIVDLAGNTLLHHCMQRSGSSTHRIAQSLINCGVPINAQNTQGCTALHHAIAQPQRYQLTALLLTHNAEINVQSGTGDTALHLAVQYAKSADTQLLLDHGANANIVNKQSQTPLHLLVARRYWIEEGIQGQLAILRLLLRYCSANTIDMLSEEEQGGSWGVPREVLKRSPLALALLAGSVDVVEELEKHGAVAYSVKEPVEMVAPSGG